MATSKKMSSKTLDLPAREAWDAIPTFTSEREEADYWASHSVGKSILDQDFVDDSGLPAADPPVRPTSIRFDRDTVARLKVVAARRGKGYQTLLKEFVLERLYEEEKREGIIETR
jgi:uncharacterized protein (DUF4415 family)